MSNKDFSKLIEQEKAEYEKLSVSELEAIAIRCYQERKYPWNPSESFTLLLEVRKDKLNANFVFTAEHIEKILQIDRQIKNHLNTLRKEGKEIIKEVEPRVKKKDSFFNVYEIEAVINPKILIRSEDDKSLNGLYKENGILDVIDIYHHVTHFVLEFDPRYNEPFFEEENWNNWIGTKNKEFADYYIGIAMCELDIYSMWSWEDIVKINDFRCEVNVKYQRLDKSVRNI
jgi:hypothetical protein